MNLSQRAARWLVPVAGFFTSHKFLFRIFLVFLILQDLLVLLTSGKVMLVVKRADEVVILISSVMLLLLVLLGKKRLSLTPIGIPLGFFIGFGILSGIVGLVPLKVLLFGLFLAIKPFLFFFLFANSGADARSAEELVKTITVSGLIVLVIGLLTLPSNWLLPTLKLPGDELMPRAGILSIRSIFAHPGGFGWFMAVVACFAFAFFAVTGSLKWSAVAVIAAIGSFYSLRDKPMGGLVAAVVCGLLVCRFAEKKRLAVAAVSAVCFIFLLAFNAIADLYAEKRKAYTYTYSDTYTPLSEDIASTDTYSEATKAPRTRLYSIGTQIARDRFPLGAGPGRYGGWISSLYHSPVYEEYGISDVYGFRKGESYFAMDTYYPHILGEFGVLGFASLCWMIVAAIIVAIRGLKFLTAGPQRAFAIGALMVFVEGLTEAIGSPVVETSLGGCLIWGGLGVTYSWYLNRNSGPNTVK